MGESTYTPRLHPRKLALIIDPISPGGVFALVPNGRYEVVRSWRDVLTLLDQHQATLHVDAQQAAEITHILNGPT
jgi:hypothetical protein